MDQAHVVSSVDHFRRSVDQAIVTGRDQHEPAVVEVHVCQRPVGLQSLAQPHSVVVAVGARPVHPFAAVG